MKIEPEVSTTSRTSPNRPNPRTYRMANSKNAYSAIFFLFCGTRERTRRVNKRRERKSRERESERNGMKSASVLPVLRTILHELFYHSRKKIGSATFVLFLCKFFFPFSHEDEFTTKHNGSSNKAVSPF